MMEEEEGISLKVDDDNKEEKEEEAPNATELQKSTRCNFWVMMMIQRKKKKN